MQMKICRQQTLAVQLLDRPILGRMVIELTVRSMNLNAYLNVLVVVHLKRAQSVAFVVRRHDE